VLDQQAGPQRIADGLAFQGISFDASGSRPCTINIGAGDSTRANVSHTVDMPLHIRCADDAEHGEVTIEIEPARGPGDACPSASVVAVEWLAEERRIQS
jgi:hypothetical protein